MKMDFESLDKEVQEKLSYIYQETEKKNINTRFNLCLVLLMFYMRFRPQESRDILTPIVNALKLGLNPYAVSWGLLKYRDMEYEFSRKAQSAYRGKLRERRRQCSKEKGLRKNTITDKYRKIFYQYQQEKEKKKRKLPWRRLEELLKDEFANELIKNPARLNSIKVQYYRVRNKIITPLMEVDEKTFIERAIIYSFLNYFECDPQKNANGDPVFLTGTSKLGQARSFYDEVMNVEKREEKAWHALAKHLQAKKK